MLRPWTADYYAHSSILAQLVSGAIAIAASLPPRPTDAGELTIEREEEKKSSVRPCNPPVPEWSCYFSELAQIPEWVRNGLVTFPSWHKSQNGLVTFPRWHKSQNGLVTFPRWHKSRNGRVTQTFWYKSELDGKDSEIWHKALEDRACERWSGGMKHPSELDEMHRPW